MGWNDAIAEGHGPALTELRQRLAELNDLGKAGALLGWDQQVMMPPNGSAVRAEQLATLSRIIHERFVDDELGRLLERLRPLEESLPYDSHEASLIRVTRRDWDKERKVPKELREEMTRVGAAGFPVWVEARAKSDFALFLPHLERNVELRRQYAQLFEGDELYDGLLDDFEPGMKTAEVRDVFARLKDELVRLAAAAPEVDDSCLRGHFPLEQQHAFDRRLVQLFGLRDGSWRLDPTTHPFASGMGIDDLRLTSRHFEDRLEGLFSTMHETGHGLYEHNVDPTLERTPLARGTSLGMHESQSRMWENLVGRSLPWWRFLYGELQQAFPDQLDAVELDTFYRAINKVQPWLIRVESDEVTYSLHIILRFELEQDLVEDRVDLRDLPEIWNARMKEYLGVDVPDDAHGVLQDVHWSRGTLGYFPTYAIGNVISLQLWEQINEAIPDLEDQLAAGEVRALCGWLREHVWQYGRKFRTGELLERITGGGLDPAPYLRYLESKVRGLATVG
jgi:carboxypeptidase Taq